MVTDGLPPPQSAVTVYCPEAFDVSPETACAGTACTVNEPRMGIEARHGLDTRLDTRKAPSREDAGLRRGATVGIAASA